MKGIIYAVYLMDYIGSIYDPERTHLLEVNPAALGFAASGKRVWQVYVLYAKN